MPGRGGGDPDRTEPERCVSGIDRVLRKSLRRELLAAIDLWSAYVILDGRIMREEAHSWLVLGSICG
jgi:hypothetical protein